MLGTLETAHSFHGKKEVKEEPQGFGTFIGVFVPSILMVFGVIIFLRMGWIVGQVGLSSALMIITFATLITMITTLSISSISTNIQVGKGGVYYILSRSLGIEIGSAVGLPLFLKQSLSIAFCVIGFAESLHDLMPAWSITQIGIWTLVTLTILAYFSLDGALKVQVGIFVIIFASLVSFFTGHADNVPPHPEAFVPEIPKSLGLWAIFAIFFPAMTGVESSVSLSGNLRNPSRSLPLGTISALLVAYLIYMLIPIFLVQHVPLERLAMDPLIMQDLASIPSLIILGIWGATISSALGGLLGAPRTLQALADDGVVPKIFGKTFGANGDPKIATLTTFFLSLCGIYFGSVNLIAPLLTMICLICYGFLNFSAGFETLMANPSWRPRFQIHWAISMLGAAMCLLAMLMIDAGMALLAIALVVIIYLVAKGRQLSGSWEDIRYGILMFFSRSAIYRLATVQPVAKSWRPHFLVFTKNAETHSNSLLRFSQAVTQSKGFLTVASFLSAPLTDETEKASLKKTIGETLKKQNIQALLQIIHAEKVTQGMHNMLDHYGIGSLTPDTIVFGGINEGEAGDFASVINKIYTSHRNVVILNENKNRGNVLNSKESLGDIHLWFDDDHQHSSNLMLVLAYMLHKNKGWRRSRLCLKNIVSNEHHRQEKIEKFKALSVSQRLPFEAEVLVATDAEAEMKGLVEGFSKDAGLIFLSLRPPLDTESMESYSFYLRNMIQFSDLLPSSVLVLAAKHTILEDVIK